MASRARRLPSHTSYNASQNVIGRAFSVEDGLLAMRWAEIVRSRGYRLTFSHSFAEADEAMEVFRHSRKRALATMFLGMHCVWIVDRTGRITPHEDVAAALIFLVDLSWEERQVLLAPHIPAWLWQFRPAEFTTQKSSRRFIGVCSKKFTVILEQIRGLRRHRRWGQA